MCGCAWTGVLTIWLAPMQFCAGALEQVFLPCGWHGYSAAPVLLNWGSFHLAGRDTVLHGWADLSECSYQLAGKDTVVSGCTWNGCSYHLPGWHGYTAAVAIERVFLPFGWHPRSAVRVRLGGCAYHVAGMATVLRGCS